jgi:hypothetical protein
MHTPAVTVEDLLNENRRLREQHAYELRARVESLTDEFAKVALPAVYAHDSTGDYPGSCTVDYDQVARGAYRVADAMMAERERRMRAAREELGP